MKTIQEKINIVCFLLLGVLSTHSFSQNIGAVVISDLDKKEPHELVIMELDSENKGVLFPRMNLNDRDNIKSPQDGLLVYVIDAHAEGFWYWDTLEGKWVRWIFEEKENGEEPRGTIIPFVGSMDFFYEDGNTNGFESGLGKINTKMQGWAICNGNNNTPNLENRYLVGAGKENTSDISEEELPDYTHIGLSGGQNRYVINQNQMYSHHHLLTPGIVNSISMKHRHKVTSWYHDHEITTFREKRSAKNYRKPDLHQIRSGYDVSEDILYIYFTGYSYYYYDQRDRSAIGKPFPTLLQKYNSNITIDFPENFLEYAGGNKQNPNNSADSVNNLPPSYTVIFIMKVGNSVYTDGVVIEDYTSLKVFDK